jgi:hypothetical protein
MLIFSFIVSPIFKKCSAQNFENKHVFVVNKLDLLSGVFVDAAVDVIAEKFQSVPRYCCHPLQLTTQQ